MTSPDNSRHVEVKDGDQTLAAAEVTALDDTEGTVRASLLPSSGHTPPGSRASLVDAVMDLPEVQAGSRLEATVPLGDAESLEQLRERTEQTVTRPAGSTALVDGDIYQLGLIQAAAAARGITVAIVIDFIHVLEYLWKAAWCFHAPRDPAMEDWVIAQALDILHGRAPDVITRIKIMTAAHPPRPGGEHAKVIRKTLHYLQAKQPYLDYPRAQAEGWPIATGVIEGACRHLVADRMGITGARWGLPGAQAMLWLRAINASGDTSAYWDYHIQQEHQRNHLSRYQDTLELAA